MQLIKDGLLTIPLFHGTSTLFLDEILTKGLGVVDPIKKYGTMETLEKLIHKGFEYIEYLPKNIPGVISGHIYLNHCKIYVNQPSGNFNYRYGSVYLSPSKITAVKYSRNKYGSEHISNTINLYLYLKEYSVPVELDNDFLNHIKNRSYQPVVIMASGIQVPWLKPERKNETIDSQFEWIQSLDMEEFDEMTQQTNFELCHPQIITPEHLTVLSEKEYNNIRDKYRGAFFR